MLAKRASGVTMGVTEPRADFLDLVRLRRSVRLFGRPMPGEIPWRTVAEAAVWAPSSCNRQAVYVTAVVSREAIQKLEELLVGGEGWLGGAEAVLLFYFAPVAYKSPAEKPYMGWLDVQAAVMVCWYMAERIGLGACQVNPNARPGFGELFGNGELVFGSALALGTPAEASPAPPRRPFSEALLKVI